MVWVCANYFTWLQLKLNQKLYSLKSLLFRPIWQREVCGEMLSDTIKKSCKITAFWLSSLYLAVFIHSLSSALTGSLYRDFRRQRRPSLMRFSCWWLLHPQARRDPIKRFLLTTQMVISTSILIIIDCFPLISVFVVFNYFPIDHQWHQ